MHSDIIADLKDGSSRRRSGKITRLIPKNALVIAQISLSLALLTTAGLFVRGALEARKTDVGFEFAGGLVIELDTTYAGYDETRTRQVYERLLERTRGLPGIVAAALTSNLPLSAIAEDASVQARDSTADPGRTVTGTQKYIVGRDYHASLGRPLLRGRGFTDFEERSSDAPAVAIIDEALAEELWPDLDPLGRIIDLQLDRDEPPIPMEVVGVAAPLLHQLFDGQAGPHIYIPFGQSFRPQMNLQVRLASSSEAAESSALALLRNEIRALDEHLPVMAMKSLRSHRDQSIEIWAVQAGANIFTVFGAVAVLLAVIGVYGVRAYVVSQRRREIGIRMALGASPRDVLWMMLREGMVVTTVGVGIGLGLAVTIGRVVASFLFEVNATDPTTFITAPLLLAAAATLAAYLPSRRATRIPPTVALRYE